MRLRANADIAPVRILVMICAVCAAWAFTFGVGTQAAVFWLADAGQDEFIIGLNAATYYLGMAAVGLFVPRLMRRFGAGCVVAGLIAFGGAVALFPLAQDVPGWFALRLLQGAGGALSIIPLEAILSSVSSPTQRARNFAFYGVTITLAAAGGLVAALHMYQPGSHLPFLLAGASALGAAVGVLAFVPAAGAAPEVPGLPLPVLRQNYVAFGTAFVQGFVEGGLITFLPLYLVSRGLPQQTVGNLVGATVAGVVLFQVPVGLLADRLGKRPVLLLCYSGLAFGLAAVPLCGAGWPLGISLFLLWACSGSLFPVSVAMLGDRLAGHPLARGIAAYMTLDCLGSVVGPACMGQAQTWLGGTGIFIVGHAAVALMLLSWLGLRLAGYDAPGVRAQESGVRGQESDLTTGEREAADTTDAAAG
jgi:MFS family permease